jgi:hypothetical protein
VEKGLLSELGRDRRRLPHQALADAAHGLGNRTPALRPSPWLGLQYGGCYAQSCTCSMGRPKSSKTDKQVKQIKRLRRELDLQKAELRTAQARVQALERRLRHIQQSPPYRFALRLWRISGWARRRSPDQDLGREALELRPLRGLAEFDSAASAPAGTEEFGERSGEDTEAARRTGLQTDVAAAIYLLGGATEAELVEVLEGLSRDPANSGALLITDCDALRRINEYGYRYEYVPPREDWETRLGHDGTAYDDFVARRLRTIGVEHGVHPLDAKELAAPS